MGKTAGSKVEVGGIEKGRCFKVKSKSPPAFGGGPREYLEISGGLRKVGGKA